MAERPRRYRLAMRVVVAAALALAFAGSASAAPLRHLTKADRAEINKTVDMVVNYGAKRVDVIRSYDWVTPEMRAGMTRKQWKTGDIPIYPFPAKGTTFHHWRLSWISDGTVGAELLLMPTLKNKFDVGPIIFNVYFTRSGSGKRWLLDGFIPAATLAPVDAKKTKVRSVRDFSPQPAMLGAAPPHGKINPDYLWFPFIGIGGAFLLLGGVALVRSRRGKRFMPRGRQSLPPLPPRVSGGRGA
jgi:hypothetical protein